MKNIVDRFENAGKVWRLIVPDIALPPDETFIIWLSNYPDDIFEKAVLQIPHRFRNKQPVDAEEVYRCVSANLKSLNDFRQRIVREKIESQRKGTND